MRCIVAFTRPNSTLPRLLDSDDMRRSGSGLDLPYMEVGRSSTTRTLPRPSYRVSYSFMAPFTFAPPESRHSVSELVLPHREVGR